ncbi:MAG TPA: YfhO family protein, partial [Polyangia bacterium]
AAGWSATVDGAPAPIVRADEVARAVAIPAGAHTVAMRYRTPGLRAGALVSLLAWIALAFAALFTRAARAPRASDARR